MSNKQQMQKYNRFVGQDTHERQKLWLVSAAIWPVQVMNSVMIPTPKNAYMNLNTGKQSG